MTQQVMEKDSTFTSAETGAELTRAVEVQGVPPEVAEEFWPFVSSMVEKSLVYGDPDYWPEDLLGDLQAGKRQLWVVIEEKEAVAFLVSTVVEVPRGKVVRMEMAGGSRLLGNLGTVVEKLEEWAREIGAGAAEVKGRRGWEKVLAPFGYEEQAVTLKKVWR